MTETRAPYTPTPADGDDYTWGAVDMGAAAARRLAIWSAIRNERRYQDKKYGCPQDRRLLLIEYLHIAQGELNEAMCAVVDGDPQHALLELLQVAAVAVACLEQHGVVERGEGGQ